MPHNQATQEEPPVAMNSPNGEPVIHCAGLTKIFRDFWFRSRVRAVDGVDLEIHQGEIFGLLGPNGSGKSTTIKMLLGLLHPSAGRVLVLGKRPEDVAVKKRIGFLPEESYLYRFLNARETLDYYGRLFHLSGRQRRKRIDELLKWVGLEHVQRRPVGEFSKGMQRKIGLAQALINDPDLLVLDEPTTGMDPVATKDFKDFMMRLKKRGKTVLLCSHLLADVEDICDRVAIMYGGRIQRAGSVDQLLTHQNKTTIRTSLLDSETIDQVEALLAKRGIKIDAVEQPRQKLESLFLEIVRDAQAQGTETSGAVSGGQLASFLESQTADDQQEQSSQGAQVLEHLVKPAPKVTDAPAAEPPKEADRVDEDLIKGLTDSSEPVQAFPEAAPAPDVETAPTEDRPAPIQSEPTSDQAEDAEKPDQSFINALADVPESEEDPSAEQEPKKKPGDPPP